MIRAAVKNDVIRGLRRGGLRLYEGDVSRMIMRAKDKKGGKGRVEDKPIVESSFDELYEAYVGKVPTRQEIPLWVLDGLKPVPTQDELTPLDGKRFFRMVRRRKIKAMNQMGPYWTWRKL